MTKASLLDDLDDIRTELIEGSTPKALELIKILKQIILEEYCNCK
jgi:hypothetical protein